MIREREKKILIIIQETSKLKEWYLINGNKIHFIPGWNHSKHHHHQKTEEFFQKLFSRSFLFPEVFFQRKNKENFFIIKVVNDDDDKCVISVFRNSINNNNKKKRKQKTKKFYDLLSCHRPIEFTEKFPENQEKQWHWPFAKTPMIMTMSMIIRFQN